ncbi:unnamed protein product [Protopolystoma xenopodis]|uniref:Uncharacterized protein n=1 Tax=Protopolystoma xenopodis TaxID=117903 RepID=A0A3S5AVJ9_9PLAT|nr:unnamed protein product [Protopolystoma xenopodis]
MLASTSSHGLIVNLQTHRQPAKLANHICPEGDWNRLDEHDSPPYLAEQGSARVSCDVGRMRKSHGRQCRAKFTVRNNQAFCHIKPPKLTMQ